MGVVMRLRRRFVLGVVVVASLNAASTGVASKRVPPISMEGLATGWVGGSPGGLEYCRLEMKSDGSGVLAVQYVRGTPAVGYRVVRTVLNGYSVHFQVEPAEAGAEPIFLGGRGYLHRLELRLGGTSRGWKRDLVLQRLGDVSSRLEAVGIRIRELEAAR
jgi:hypothetical protein